MGVIMDKPPMEYWENKLREEIEYNPETGILWNKKTNKEFGRVINRSDTDKSRRQDCYIKKCSLCIRLGGMVYYKKLSCHRVAWFLYYGEWPDGNIDHIDNDPLNNKIDNLQLLDNLSLHVAKRINMIHNKTGFRGVYKHLKKYQAMISIKKKNYHVGMYDTPEEAARARDRKAIELWGDCAILNFPREDYDIDS